MKYFAGMLLMSLLVLGCGDEDMLAPTEEGEVGLVATKTEYTPGEDIEAVLTNRTATSVLIRACGFFQVYRRVDDDWRNVSGMCTYLPPFSEVPPGETHTRTMKYEAQSLPPGEYRLGESVCDRQADNCTVVFSEPFSLME